MTNSNFYQYLTQKAGLKEDELKALKFAPRLAQYQKGDFIFQSGEIVHSIFFIEKGLVKQYSIDEQGKEHIIHFAPENWIVSDRSSAYFGLKTEYIKAAVLLSKRA